MKIGDTFHTELGSVSIKDMGPSHIVFEIQKLKIKLQASTKDFKKMTTKLQAKARLLADHEDPTADGTAYDLLDDSEEESPPIVQELTIDDGDNLPSSEQDLLVDDLPISG